MYSETYPPRSIWFLKGRNIGSNIRLILDIIDYTDFNEIPGAILLLDIEKAFDSVNHDFLLQVLNILTSVTNSFLG